MESIEMMIVKVGSIKESSLNESIEKLSKEISLTTAKSALLKRQVIRINENRDLDPIRVQYLLDEIFYDVFHNIDTWRDFEEICFKYFDRMAEKTELFESCVSSLMLYIWLRREDGE